MHSRFTLFYAEIQITPFNIIQEIKWEIPEAIQKVFGLLAILKLQLHETCRMSLFDLGAPLKFSLFSFNGEY